jgi:hypothetical protein
MAKLAEECLHNIVADYGAAKRRAGRVNQDVRVGGAKPAGCPQRRAQRAIVNLFVQQAGKIAPFIALGQRAQATTRLREGGMEIDDEL